MMACALSVRDFVVGLCMCWSYSSRRIAFSFPPSKYACFGIIKFVASARCLSFWVNRMWTLLLSRTSSLPWVLPQALTLLPPPSPITQFIPSDDTRCGTLTKICPVYVKNDVVISKSQF
jgi:hypothetical protein